MEKKYTYDGEMFAYQLRWGADGEGELQVLCNDMKEFDAMAIDCGFESAADIFINKGTIISFVGRWCTLIKNTLVVSAESTDKVSVYSKASDSYKVYDIMETPEFDGTNWNMLVTDGVSFNQIPTVFNNKKFHWEF